MEVILECLSFGVFVKYIFSPEKNKNVQYDIGYRACSASIKWCLTDVIQCWWQSGPAAITKEERKTKNCHTEGSKDVKNDPDAPVGPDQIRNRTLLSFLE